MRGVIKIIEIVVYYDSNEVDEYIQKYQRDDGIETKICGMKDPDFVECLYSLVGYLHLDGNLQEVKAIFDRDGFGNDASKLVRKLNGPQEGKKPISLKEEGLIQCIIQMYNDVLRKKKK